MHGQLAATDILAAPGNSVVLVLDSLVACDNLVRVVVHHGHDVSFAQLVLEHMLHHQIVKPQKEVVVLCERTLVLAGVLESGTHWANPNQMRTQTNS